MELCIGASRLKAGRSHESADELALIERCQRQDWEAFGKLVDAYQNRIYGFVRRLAPNPDDALDITQDVFIRAFQSFSKFDGRSSLRTWLFRIAHNLCIDRARKLGRRVDEVGFQDGEDGLEFEVADDRWQADLLLLNQEFSAVVEAAIVSMSEKLRSVLILHDREEMAYEEIAEAIGIPIGTVKSRLFLARAYLQRAVQDYVGTSGTEGSR